LTGVASAGLKTSQFSVLVAVANREKLRPAELTKLLQLDQSTLSRNVGRVFSSDSKLTNKSVSVWGDSTVAAFEVCPS
jgi:hypothetical protein